MINNARFYLNGFADAAKFIKTIGKDKSSGETYLNVTRNRLLEGYQSEIEPFLLACREGMYDGAKAAFGE